MARLQVVDCTLDVHLPAGHLLPHHAAVLQQEVDGVEDVPRLETGQQHLKRSKSLAKLPRNQRFEGLQGLRTLAKPLAHRQVRDLLLRGVAAQFLLRLLRYHAEAIQQRIQGFAHLKNLKGFM